MVRVRFVVRVISVLELRLELRLELGLELGYDWS